MSSTRTYGELWLDGDRWNLQAEPHVAMWAKRIFKRLPKSKPGGIFEMSDNPATCRDLLWFIARFPLRVAHHDYLERQAAEHVDHIATLDQIIDPNYKPRLFELTLPVRDYQNRAAELFLRKKSLLLADDVGLGKTISGLASLTEPATLPALVVCMAHLPKQWQRELTKFAPALTTHILKQSSPYELPKVDGRGPDVLLSSYHKLDGWRDVHPEYIRTVIFDECQELRRSDSLKYDAAARIARAAEYRLGLSATPIYNFGGEIFNVMNILQPGCLGTREEFITEWCAGDDGDKSRIKNPNAFGSWMREQHLMLRRTRKDVGRELPALTRVTHSVDCDIAVLKAIEGQAGELARIILGEVMHTSGLQKMQAAEEFSVLLRQMTGIAKAPYVAEFVKLLLENGEPVVLFGWHRAVYSIWLEKLKEFRPVLYTGSESPNQKQASVDKFVGRDTDCFIMSLRAGAGVEGLQKRCRTVVFGELDWSPGVLQQCVGRIYRDGQPDKVAAYFLLSSEGADPMMAETLGLKRDQIEGIRGRDPDDVLQRDDGQTIKRLAEQYLTRARRKRLEAANA